MTVSEPGRINKIPLDRTTVVMASCLTLIVPSWNRIAVILDRVFMVMASCRTVSGPSREIITLDRITVIITSCWTLFVPSWTTIAVSLDVTVMTRFLTVSVPRQEKNAKQKHCVYGQLPDLVPSWSRIVILDRVVMAMASCLILSVPW